MVAIIYSDVILTVLERLCGGGSRTPEHAETACADAFAALKILGGKWDSR